MTGTGRCWRSPGTHLQGRVGAAGAGAAWDQCDPVLPGAAAFARPSGGGRGRTGARCRADGVAQPAPPVAGPAPASGAWRPRLSRAGLVGSFVLVVLTVQCALWDAFLVPLRLCGVVAPVSVLFAVANVPLVYAARRPCCGWVWSSGWVSRPRVGTSRSKRPRPGMRSCLSARSRPSSGLPCRTGPLVRYLYGPGRHNEHADQRLVACWSGTKAVVEQVWTGGQVVVGSGTTAV